MDDLVCFERELQIVAGAAPETDQQEHVPRDGVSRGWFAAAKSRLLPAVELPQRTGHSALGDPRCRTEEAISSVPASLKVGR
jgi:hypothetical protein